ncbi:MAG: TIGR03016 family PEP-CTERM system-associated outer membrane protein [Gammaproteobacteria bacterium]|nr:TIGR03016 family PEP-CTERM system-associated outer membrane protein [Gammaproteobacteria bacterium]
MSDSRLALSVFATLLASGVVHAADWQVQPRVTIGGTYTDNVGLQAGAANNESIIMQVTPGISVRGEGARLSANLDYNLQGVAFLDDIDRSRVNHQLQLSSTTQLIPGHLSLDMGAGAYQALLDNELPYGNTNLNISRNQTDVAYFRARPSYRHQFGSFAILDAGYGYSRSFVHGRQTGDQGGQDANVSLSSGSDFTWLSWSLNYSYQRNEANRFGRNRNFEMATAQISLALTDRVRLNGSAGREVNSFQSSRPTGAKTIWSGGLTWAPSRRTTVSASIGERAYGRNYSLNVSHQRRRVAVSVQYGEDYQTYLGILQQTVLVPVLDQFGNPIFDPLRGVAILLPIDLPTLTDEVFLSRRWNASLSYNRKRDTFSLSAYRNDRERETSLIQDVVTGATATWSHNVSRAVTTRLDVSAQHSEFSDRADGDYLLHVSPSLSYRFGRSLSGSLSYRYYRRISDDVRRDYVENAVTGTLTYLF